MAVTALLLSVSLASFAAGDGEGGTSGPAPVVEERQAGADDAAGPSAATGTGTLAPSTPPAPEAQASPAPPPDAPPAPAAGTPSLPSTPESQASPEPTLDPLSPESADLVQVMFELESQLNQMVVSGAKVEQRVTETPAVITVVKREEIEAHGYRSLADLLRSVPGLYDVYDGVSHNFGVRGINAGARASGSVLKIMIDGQAVPYRPSTGNFFGEELIPLEAVERVEIIRGPASALYGANAFLGVVNVITRNGGKAQGLRVQGLGGIIRSAPGRAGSLLLGAGDEKADVLVAASAALWDRSGLSLPQSSPKLADLAGRGASHADFARPQSLLARASVGEKSAGRVTALATLQSLDAAGEFQDFGPLTHGTRIALLNQTYRLSWNREWERFGLQFSGAWFDSSPLARERFDLGDGATRLLRRAGASGLEVSAEAQGRPIDKLVLTAGADFQHEEHLLQSWSTLLLEDVRAADGSILRAAGTVIPGAEDGRKKTFENLGGFVQAIWQATGDLSATAGARVDRHNVYKTHLSPRAALVWAPREKPYHLKALYGASFKAPSAEQLYTQPMRPFDVKGNAELAAQTAQTGELAGGWQMGETGEISANLFLTRASGRVEFVQRGLYLSAENALDETYLGGEVQGRARLASPLFASLGVGVARLLSREAESGSAGAAANSDMPLFPVFQAHLSVDWRLPWLGLRFLPEVSYVGPRASSQSNALVAGKGYSVPGYVWTAATLSLPEHEWLSGRPTALSLRATDLLSTQAAEPGFGGVDLPPAGRTVFLSLTQKL